MAVPVAVQKASPVRRWHHVLVGETRLVAGVVGLAGTRHSLAVAAKKPWRVVETRVASPWAPVRAAVACRLSVRRVA